LFAGAKKNREKPPPPPPLSTRSAQAGGPAVPSMLGRTVSPTMRPAMKPLHSQPVRCQHHAGHGTPIGLVVGLDSDLVTTEYKARITHQLGRGDLPPHHPPPPGSLEQHSSPRPSPSRAIHVLPTDLGMLAGARVLTSVPPYIHQCEDLILEQRRRASLLGVSLYVQGGRL